MREAFVVNCATGRTSRRAFNAAEELAAGGRAAVAEADAAAAANVEADRARLRELRAKGWANLTVLEKEEARELMLRLYPA